jgi:predicted nucleic acid-binding Zn ribbon protein
MGETTVSTQAEQTETKRRQAQRVRSMLAFMLVLVGIMFGLGLLRT